MKHTNRLFIAMAVVRAVNLLIPMFFAALPIPFWCNFLLSMIVLGLPVIGWLVSFGVWVWAFIYLGNERTLLFVVLFVLECLYFVYRLVIDRIQAYRNQ